MIRINLLPYQKAAKAKKQQVMEAQLLISGAVIAVVVLFMLFVWWSFSVTIDDLTVERNSMTAQLEVLKKKVQEVKDVEKKTKLVEQKIAIIGKLKTNQQGPVRILDELSRLLPERVWLDSLIQQGDTFNLKGKATTNFEIVEYVNRLKSSDYISGVVLTESRQGTEQSLKIFNFTLKFIFSG